MARRFWALISNFHACWPPTQVTTIDDNITSTAERSKEGTQQLVKASRSQRAQRNKCLWLWLVAALVVSLIIIITFA